MDLGLRERVCVVTGSTGGIGLGQPSFSPRKGRRWSSRVAARSGSTGPGKRSAPPWLVCDLAEPAAPSELIAQATAEVEPVQVLVNNVGVAYQVPFEELTDEQWDEM